MEQVKLQQILDELQYSNFVRDSDQKSLLREIAFALTDDLKQSDERRIPRLGYLYETEAIKEFDQWSRTREESRRNRVRDYFESAYVCWKTLANLFFERESFQSSKSTPRPISEVGLKILQEELPEPLLKPDINLALRLAVSGVLAERAAEVRLELTRFDLNSTPSDIPISWKELVMHHIARAISLLCRKGQGWEDIENASTSLYELRKLQEMFEDKYIEQQGNTSQQTIAALELLGLYNLAQVVTLTGDYIREGVPDQGSLVNRLDRHRDRARDVFTMSRAPLLLRLGDLIWVGCRILIENSLWSHVQGLGQYAIDFAKALMKRGRPNPVLELWPAQQLAFRSNLFDPYRRAILVEMPTSAGKTLLAKFVIVQTKALNPDGTIAYVIPTRALVNQVTHDLRSEFSVLSKPLRVEQAIPVFELDPTEEQLLNSPPDILVTTPEKLDLLVRKNHPATHNLVLVVADEIHNLADVERGPRLELLLGTLKRDKGNARFLLLSPFIPNADELVAWLGDGKQLPPIKVDWKPARRIVGAIELKGRKSKRQLTFETLPAADNSDVRPGLHFTIGPAEWARDGKAGLTIGSVRALADRGGILVLCRGKGTAKQRAKQIADVLDTKSLSEQAEAVCAYIEAETGRTTALVDCIRKGVAFHHAGLSQETRWLIENLIRSKDVGVVCGTTTLAQGVNFPISTVLVETLKKGNIEPLKYEEFWNIAGRAGRTLLDTMGIVAFPVRDRKSLEECIGFLQHEAREVASQLASIIENADQIQQKFDLQTIYNWPALSPLLQFLAHALKVAGKENLADEVEDVLRASLIYYQAKKVGDEPARKLIELCRSYLESLEDRRGVLALADQTGFSTPSVLKILAQMNDAKRLKDPDTWTADALFGKDTDSLTERIDLISQLPEIRLGSGEKPPFNPERVAKILRDWVAGMDLHTIATSYFHEKGEDQEKTLSRSNDYIFSRLAGLASWGLAALATVSLAEATKEEWKRVGHIPSMVYYGVRTREAVWFRMVGVPRVLAEGLSNQWRQASIGEPKTYNDIRNWVNSLTDENWRQAIPERSPLKPKDCYILWKMLSGA